MTHAGWTHTRLGQPIVKPRCRAVSQIVADGVMYWREDLEQNEQHSDESERACQAAPLLHGIDQNAHRHRKSGWEDAAKNQDGPPRAGKRPVRLRQNGEEL